MKIIRKKAKETNDPELIEAIEYADSLDEELQESKKSKLWYKFLKGGQDWLEKNIPTFWNGLGKWVFTVVMSALTMIAAKLEGLF